jgi:murein L,D-transpeptidase YcbB/YkuD
MILVLVACNNSATKKPAEKVIVDKPEQMETVVSENIDELLSYLKGNEGKLNDSVHVDLLPLVDKEYQNNSFHTIWSKDQKWLPIADSMFYMVMHAKEYGLFPTDYHAEILNDFHNKIIADPSSKKNAILWTRADVLLTDAWFGMARDMKLGRLENDSVTLRNDAAINDQYFYDKFQGAISTGNVLGVLREQEPTNRFYTALKEALPSFLDTAKFKKVAYIIYPNKDSLALSKQVLQRLVEEGYLLAPLAGDTTSVKKALTVFQHTKKIKETGKINESVVRNLNYTDWEKFKRIALNLDRYKQLPDSLPQAYAWVNLPAFLLRVFDTDTIALQSKVICGSPVTRTPLLTSAISNFITYPQWTVPYSIIFKEMLPRIQKNTDYLDKQNLMVIDANDSVIDPKTIDWSKLDKTHFPYLLKQRQGDDNSLGVIKFNFPNKYSVYMHDTNARKLFSNSYRALSHGCVRVQDWKIFSDYLIRNDTLKFPADTINAWMERQEKHVVSGFKKLPLYIRYNTCEGNDGKVKFYDDIYGVDRMLSEKYFANKNVY